MSGSSYFIYQDGPWGLCDKVTAYQALWCPSEGNSNWWDHLKISYLTKLEPSLRGSSSGGGILPEPDHTYYKLTITGFFSLSLPLLSLSIPALPRHSPKHQIQGSHFWCGLGVPSWMVHYLPLKPDLTSLNKIQVAQIYCELGVSSMMVHYLKKVYCNFLVRLGN